MRTQWTLFAGIPKEVPVIHQELVAWRDGQQRLHNQQLVQRAPQEQGRDMLVLNHLHVAGTGCAYWLGRMWVVYTKRW